MRVLLTGASSSPGYKTLLELAGKGYQVYAVYNSHPIDVENSLVKPVRLDLTETEKVVDFFNKVKPDIVIHMAALGDVNLCEENKDLAWRVNVETTKLLARLARKNGTRFLYLSTDYVFDGKRGMYREDDTPSPVNYYGLTKLVAEEIVKSMLDDYIIVRTSAVYGLGMGRINFGKFLIEALSGGREVRAIVDQWLSPTLNTLLARAVVELLEKDAWGLYHVAGERVSRYEFAVKLAERFGFDTSLVKPAKMSDFSWRARRPRDSSLDPAKARSTVSVNFSSLDYSLDLLYEEWVRRAGGV